MGQPQFPVVILYSLFSGVHSLSHVVGHFNLPFRSYLQLVFFFVSRECIIIYASIYCLHKSSHFQPFVSKNSFRVVHICSKIILVMVLRVAQKQPPLRERNKYKIQWYFVVCFDVDFFMLKESECTEHTFNYSFC